LEHVPAGQVMPAHGSSSQTPAMHVWPAPQPLPSQRSVTQAPSMQIFAPQFFPEQGSTSQNPYSPQRWPLAHLTNAHDWTQSPPRQKVPLGHATPAHGSETHEPPRHTWPAPQPVA
jgi:hypothetical protein